MNLMQPWWIIPLILFVLPLLGGLLYNRLRRHKRGVESNWVLAMFVIACWVSAFIIILNAVR